MSSLGRLCVVCVFLLNISTVSAQVTPTYVSAYPTSYTITDTMATGQSVALVVVSDSDSTPNVAIAMSPNTYFDFTDNGDLTGTVKTSASNALTGASGTSQTLTFVSTDNSSVTATTSYIIAIANTIPTLSGLPTTDRVKEDVTADTLVYTITCTDPSDSVFSAVASITPSNSPNSEFFFIQVIPTTTSYGVYARSQTNTVQGVFDYDTRMSYVIGVRCSDGKQSVTKSLTVNLIRNQPPVITNMPSPTVQSVATTTGNGQTVFTVNALDNEGDTVTFNHTCDPTGCPFTVISASANTATVMTTVDLSTLTSGSTLGYDMHITPIDSRNTGDTKILTILITRSNNAPTFSNLNNSVTVDENTAVSTTLFAVTTADADGDTVTVTFTSDPTSGTSLFDIDTSGKVTVKSALDYESLTNRTYIMTVLASDTKVTSTATLTVYVNDVNEAFTWNSATYRANVNDGTAVNTTITVTSFGVTEPDVNDTLACNMTCSPAGYFSMSSDCIVTVTSVYSLDEGLANTVTCSVTGTDEGENSATTSLVFDIVDANNYTPVFEESGYNYDISPYQNTSVTLGQVNATDRDQGTFGQFTYSINQAHLLGTYFSINSATGQFSTTVSMETCNCSGSTLAIPVYATDGGGLIGTSTIYVTLSVTSTTTSTTTTERPKQFLEESSNTSWFAVLMALLGVTAIVTGYVCIKHVYKSSWNMCSKGSYKPSKPSPPEPGHTDNSTNNANGQDRQHNNPRASTSRRNMAPPKHQQGWRNEKFL